MTSEQKQLIEKARELGLAINQVSDGYHTFDELYDYRMAYNAALFNEYALNGKYDVHKSLRHADGELCFGGGWFVVVAELPTGQITNHYPMKDWEQFQIPEREKASEWDGHSPEAALNRLKGMSALMDEMKESERVKRHQQAILEKGFNRLVDGEGLE